MRIPSFDIECNQPSNEIIELGAVVGDTKMGLIIAKFSVLIKCSEPLSEWPKAHCKITDEMLATEGVTLIEGYEKLKSFITEHCKLKDGEVVNPLTWGGPDTEMLREQLARQGRVFAANNDRADPKEKFIFGSRSEDVKTIFRALCDANDLDRLGGLRKSMKRLELKFEGQTHRALPDALNTFLMYCKMLNLIKLGGIRK